VETLNLGIDGLNNIEQIGAGGASRVYRAKQVELDRLVALKVINAGDDPNVLRRFDRERRAMGRLSLNDGIVPVYSSGLTDRGEPYLIMPYYKHGSLQDRIKAGPVPWREAVAYIAAAAKTMAAAHEAGVVHLDLKPANILLTSDFTPRIADFGIAKLANDPTAASNTTGTAFTPTFSAPEILLGEVVTSAADVYGLAATLWSLIAGRPPFRAESAKDNTLMAVVSRVVKQPVDDLRHLAPDPVCQVIETGMAKRPTGRYNTAGSFAFALSAALDASQPETLAPQANPSGPNQAVPILAPAAQGGGNGATTIGPVANQPQTGGSLRFADPVPSHLLQQATVPGRGSDAITRGSVVGIVAVAAVATVVGFFGLQALNRTDGTASTLPTEAAATDNLVTTPDVNTAAGATAITNTTPIVSSTQATAQPTQSTTTTRPASSTTTTSPTSIISTTNPLTTSSTRASTTSSASSGSSTASTSTTTDSSTTSSSTSTSTTTVPVEPTQLGRPKSLSAEQTATGVRLSWSAPADNDGLAGYTILRDGSELGTADGNTYLDTSVVDGEVYRYQVRADGPPGGEPENSENSDAVEITIAAEAEPEAEKSPEIGAL